MDVFSGNAFQLATLTTAINTLPHKPRRIGELEIFAERGVQTTRVGIEERNGVLTLVPNLPRGAPATPHTTSRRKMLQLATTHLPVRGRVYADEVQDVREFGTEGNPRTVQTVVNERLAEMRNNIEATIEWQRLGAIRGQVLDADGSVIVNLFDEFGVTAQTEVDFDLDAGSPAPGAVRAKCSAIIRTIEDELGDGAFAGIHALCGSAFFDALVDHPECREAYARWNDGEALRARVARSTFFYAGIMFEEYRGKVDGQQFIDPDKAHIFATGFQGLFQTAFAPAGFVEFVNTVGLPLYAKSVPDPANRWADLYGESNPISYCTRPRTLISARRT
jgi:hypothetical protein